jgi:uncharacterized protein YtpQ (UPF0354 family)
LLDDIWHEHKIDIRDDYVVAIPSRDLLLVTAPTMRRGSRKCPNLAQKTVAEGPYHLTSDLFIYREGRFKKFAQ